IVVPDDMPTIQWGIEEAKDGDTVLVMPGTYTENLDYYDKSIVVMSLAGPDSTFLSPADPNAVAVNIASGNSEETIFSGFTLSGGSNSHTIFVNNGASPLIRNNIFCNNLPDGILSFAVITCWDSVGIPVIERNIFYENRGKTSVWIMYGKAYIVNNTFSGNQAAVMCNSGQATAINNIVYGSLGTAMDGSYAELDYICFFNNEMDFG
ncbi:MAG: right-handed parallel beta-helix repeat-containing protein, partial [Candidatus Zixiibacteriota bacterium]